MLIAPPTIRATVRQLVIALVGLTAASEARAQPKLDDPGVTEAEVVEPESVEPESVSTVVVQSVLSEGEDVRASVEERLREDLAGENTSTPDGEPIVIVISEASDDAAALRIEFRHNDQEIHAWTCRCSAIELQEQLPGHTKEALRLAQAAPEPAPAPVLAPPTSQPQLDPRVLRRFKRTQAMFSSGLIMVTVGGGVALTGSVTLIAAAAVKNDPLQWAIISAAAGGAIAAVGVPLLVVGERRRRSSHPVSVRLAPTGPGLALRGRF